MKVCHLSITCRLPAGYLPATRPLQHCRSVSRPPGFLSWAHCPDVWTVHFRPALQTMMLWLQWRCFWCPRHVFPVCPYRPGRCPGRSWTGSVPRGRNARTLENIVYFRFWPRPGPTWTAHGTPWHPISTSPRSVLPVCQCLWAFRALTKPNFASFRCRSDDTSEQNA